ncbi:heat shock 70 kDa protein 14-like [Watersipora subatra]|uniref:heat shock 70 kDa protein 14-like n=1 Tax=Watersipora subatra TaxID=2589382 RepID=UPI00355B7C22
MATAFGIHLGASNACLSICKDGNIEVIANAAGDRVTPILIAFSDHDKVVGLPAKQGLIRNAKNTACHIKKLLGKDFADPGIQKEKQTSQCSVIEKDGRPFYQVQYMQSQKSFSPEQCSTFIFGSLLEIAKNHGDTNAQDVVISVPHNFGKKQQTAVIETATKAGFKVMRLIHEPTSALLAYGLGQKHRHEHINAIVVRVGGSSSTVSCFSITDGMYRLLSDVNTDDIAGDMFTELIADHFAADFQRQFKANPKENKRAWNKLLSASETCKHTLTTLPNAHCSIDSLHEGIDFSGNIARGRMDMLSLNLLSKLQTLIDECLVASGLERSNIQKVILSGGGTKLQCVVKKIQDIFKDAELYDSIATDEVIAFGAATQASIILSSCEGESVLPTEELPTLTRCINCAAQGSCIEELFHTGHSVPAKAKRTYCSSQSTFRLLVTQGSDTPIEVLAKLALKDVGEGAVVEVHFSIDREGLLHISCVDEKSKAHTEVTVPTCNDKQMNCSRS